MKDEKMEQPLSINSITADSPNNSSIVADSIIVGGGIAGMTAAVELAETGRHAVLIEREASLGGRVAGMNQYFPKLCPPSCGLEINLRRIKNSPNIEVLTLAEIEEVKGSAGNYDAMIRLNPRFVNERCTACGKCAEVCEIERENEFNYGMDKTKAIYLPHIMAYPFRYVIDPRFTNDDRMKKCVEICEYGAIDLSMKSQTISIKTGAIIWATGWKPYDAAKLDGLGFGQFANVITNVMMERIASQSGPNGGKILRPSDMGEVKSIGFVQCAGSRDENHLPYCSAVCCMASMKQATYIRAAYPDAEIHLFYIDVRSPGRMEDFYTKVQGDTKIHFHRGKVAKIIEVPGTKNLILEAENTLTGDLTKTEVDLAVLAVGMVPNAASDKLPLGAQLDEFGFIAPNAGRGIIATGTTIRPMDVASSARDATGAALKAIRIRKGE
jgi:quinone-modifying oxidoreductase subunit QmoA